MQPIYEIMAISWDIFQDSAIYMLIGFLIAGVLQAFFKPEMVTRYLGRGKVRPVLLSALAGVPIPLCSCGVIPAAASLKQQGANNGATLSFMISTPESGVDSIPVTYAFLDPILTVIRPLAAFVTAAVAGIAENFLHPVSARSPFPANPGTLAACGCSGGCAASSGPPASRALMPLSSRVRNGLGYAFGELLGDIGLWFLLGVFLAGIIAYLIPADFMASHLGNPYLAMVAMLLAGIPIYVCATSSTPIAAALIVKGLNPGAALVFLLSGPATNIASLTMVSGILGRRALMVYLTSIAFCSLLLGFLTDRLYAALGVSAQAVVGEAMEIFPPWMEFGAALALSACLAYAIGKRLWIRK